MFVICLCLRYKANSIFLPSLLKCLCLCLQYEANSIFPPCWSVFACVCGTKQTASSLPPSWSVFACVCRWWRVQVSLEGCTPHKSWMLRAFSYVHMCVPVFMCLWWWQQCKGLVCVFSFPCVLELSRRTASCTICGQLAIGIAFCVAVSWFLGLHQVHVCVCVRVYVSVVSVW